MPNSQSILRSDAYRVLKVGAEFMTRREKKMLEKIKSADPESESLGSNLVRLPERTFDVIRDGQKHNCFVFEPLGPSLLEFINRPANKPLGIRRVRVTVALLLHALEFLHTNGIGHTGKQYCRKALPISSTDHTQTSSLTISNSRSRKKKTRSSTSSAPTRDCLPALQDPEETNRSSSQAAR
jgi:hypothetical protein